MNANYQRLKELENTYKVIGNSEMPVVNGVQTTAVAFVSSERSNPRSQSINFSLAGEYKNANSMANMVASNAKNKYFMPMGKSRQERLQYPVTHEYGHMLQNVLFSKSGKNDREAYADKVAKGIIKNAQKKYGMRGWNQISVYGRRNPHEFFAEAFANAHSTRPNAVGLAMRDYLKEQGY